MYSICQKHGVSFETIEQEFASRYEVIAWILKNQLDRRNINNSTRTYLIGRRYLVEKRESAGRPKGSKEFRQNVGINETAEKIGNIVNVSYRTVERAAEYTQAIDTIVSTTGIKVSDILSGRMQGYQDKIRALSEMDVDSQKRIAHLILEEGAADLETATDRLILEKMDRSRKEAEEKAKKSCLFSTYMY